MTVDASLIDLDDTPPRRECELLARVERAIDALADGEQDFALQLLEDTVLDFSDSEPRTSP